MGGNRRGWVKRCAAALSLSTASLRFVILGVRSGLRSRRKANDLPLRAAERPKAKPEDPCRDGRYVRWRDRKGRPSPHAAPTFRHGSQGLRLRFASAPPWDDEGATAKWFTVDACGRRDGRREPVRPGHRAFLTQHRCRYAHPSWRHRRRRTTRGNRRAPRGRGPRSRARSVHAWS